MTISYAGERMMSIHLFLKKCANILLGELKENMIPCDKNSTDIVLDLLLLRRPVSDKKIRKLCVIGLRDWQELQISTASRLT